MNTIGTIAQTDVYFVAACLAFILGVIVGSILAGRRGKTEKPAPVEFYSKSRRVQILNCKITVHQQELMLYPQEIVLRKLVGKIKEEIIPFIDMETTKAEREGYWDVRGTLRVVEPEKGPWYDERPDQENQKNVDKGA